jgi:hypothetical protein
MAYSNTNGSPRRIAKSTTFPFAGVEMINIMIGNFIIEAHLKIP